MTKLLAATILGTVTATALFAAAPLTAKPATAPKPAAVALPWDKKLSRSPAGNHVIGNPAAKVRLVEFMSYTCPHCAHYAHDSKVPLLSGPVRQGKVAIEVRPFFRNIIDVSASLLALCGADSKFLGNHHAIMEAQANWLKAPPEGAQQRWATEDFGAKMKTVAQDMGLYSLMTARGYTPAQLDQCLADRTLADKLANQTNQAMQGGVNGTPSFMINGKLQEAHEWKVLQPLLTAAIR